MKRQVVRIAFFVVLAAVVVTNLVNLWRMQEVQPYRQVRRSLQGTANGRTVEATYAVYYFLRRHLAGKHVIVPVALHEHSWSFERIAHLDLQNTDVPLELDPRWIRRHRRRATGSFALRIAGHMRELYVFVDKDADRYVIAQQRGAELPALVLLSEERYREIEARP